MEYIVTVADPGVWDTLWDELTENGLGDNYIPDRAVPVINERPFNDFSAHFDLTEAESMLLRQDPRIAAVELQADQQPGVEKRFSGQRFGNYDRHPTTTTNTMKNWGLLRCTSADDPFGAATSLETNYEFNLDGTGVDIILLDTGIEPNHPEFAVNPDGTGGSRVVDFNWASLGVPGTPSASSIGGYLGDSDGHGSNCASIAAGSTCGWAPKAKIYSIRIFGGNNIRTGASLGAINSDIAFDLVRAFHLKKIAEGNTRPTICSNSWGYYNYYSGMVSTTYRGQTYSASSYSAVHGQMTSVHGYRVTYVDMAVENCAASGAIMIGAAGNYRHKIDIPGGQDYDNHWTSSWGSTYYYHRGSSPTATPSMITVGATDTVISNPPIERKAYFSETGPRVDVYAPGTMIMGAYANKGYITAAVPDPRQTGFFLNKISGTSQATPQVAGYVACILQLRPTYTLSEIKAFIKENGNKNKLQEGPLVWTNLYNLQGGENNYLKMPFTNPRRGSISS
jgi:Subtilase family